MNTLKKLAVATFLVVLNALFVSTANAGLIGVYQGGSYLGSIDSYSGSASAATNWTLNYGPTVGPAGVLDTGSLFFYQSVSDGLTFNILWNDDGVNDGVTSNVNWGINVTGTSSFLIESDDNSAEFSSPSTNNYSANWSWGGWADGGIIGGLTGTDWEITIDAKSYTDIAGLFARDENSDIVLSLDTSKDITFKLVSVPEPTTMTILALCLLFSYRLTSFRTNAHLVVKTKH